MSARLFTGMGLTLALCACVSTPQPNPALEDAHIAVQTAESDPNVARYAPLDLEAAKRDLAAADEAAAHHQDAAIAQHAYLATQSARLAQAHAATRGGLTLGVAAGRRAERDRIMLARAQSRSERRPRISAIRQRRSAIRQRRRRRGCRRKCSLTSRETPTPRGLVLTLGDVMFDTGKAELNPGAGRKLDQVAQFLNEHKDRRVQIDGFTDSVGGDSYNEGLSQRRAQAVKSAPVGAGIDSSRISHRAMAREFPVASNSESRWPAVESPG